MRILITGGSGFIGTNLCHYLLKQGHHVYCLDNNYTGRMSNIHKLTFHPNFVFIKHDICNKLTDLDCFKELISHKTPLQQIYNLACPASPPAYQGIHAIETTKTCVLGAINVLDLALQHQAVVLQASTSEIYGDPLEHPQKESYRGNVNPIGIRSCYDEGKRCAESLFFDYARHKGALIKVIRIFNTYGPFMDPQDGRVISNFICKALQGEDIEIYGDGLQTRSFCYIDDLIDGMVRMMNSDSSIQGPINLGNNQELAIKDLAELMLRLIHSSSKVTFKKLPQDDPTRRQPSILKAKELLDWQPHTSLERGLEQTIAYFAKQLCMQGLVD